MRVSGGLTLNNPPSKNQIGGTVLEIKYKNIILRDMVESDIDDEIRWWTVDTDWGDWDAPWEPLTPIDPVQHRQKLLDKITQPKHGHRWSMEIATADGVHIGKTNSYLIDERYDWISLLDVAPGQQVFHTLGIDLMEKAFWGSGYAKESCEALIARAFAGGAHRIYAECDPENTGSWKLLEALGFEREAHLKRNIYFWRDEQGRPIWKDTYIYAKVRD